MDLTIITISDATAFTAGILLLSLVTIELGGTYLLRSFGVTLLRRHSSSRSRGPVTPMPGCS